MGRATAQVLSPGYYVYIGPTIRSFCQHNSIYTGSREDVEKLLARAIEKYPPIAQLLVSGDELAEARQMIKQPGNRIFEQNKRLIRLLTTNGG